jgi:hypothetical protein
MRELVPARRKRKKKLSVARLDPKLLQQLE